MVKRIITYGGIAFLLFFIVYRPGPAGDVFSAGAGAVSFVIDGFVDFFQGLIG